MTTIPPKVNFIATNVEFVELAAKKIITIVQHAAVV
jgi:hypothetical protein